MSQERIKTVFEQRRDYLAETLVMQIPKRGLSRKMQTDSKLIHLAGYFISEINSNVASNLLGLSPTLAQSLYSRFENVSTESDLEEDISRFRLINHKALFDYRWKLGEYLGVLWMPKDSLSRQRATSEFKDFLKNRGITYDN